MSCSCQGVLIFTNGFNQGITIFHWQFIAKFLCAAIRNLRNFELQVGIIIIIKLCKPFSLSNHTETAFLIDIILLPEYWANNMKFT